MNSSQGEFYETPQSPEEETTFRLRLRRRLHHHLRRLSLLPLGVIFAFTVSLLGLVAYLLNSARWVEHTHEVLANVSQIEKLAMEMETSVRGYRLTSDRTYLEPFDAASAALPVQFETLVLLLEDNPAQLTKLRELQESLRAWSEFATGVRERTASQEPVDVMRQGDGKILMDAVRGHTGEMQAHEQSLLGHRSRTLGQVRLFTMSGVLLAGLLFAPLLVISIRRTIEHLDSSYRAAWSESDRERERLDVTLSSIGDAVISTNKLGAVSYLNPVATSLTGWSNEEAHGKPLDTVFKIINEYTRDTVESPIACVFREGTSVPLANHTLLLAKDGREIPIADSAAPIRDRDGQIMGAVMVFRDQTQERQAEERLRESEARKAAILNSSIDAILSMDSGGLIVEFNPAAEAMFGHVASDVIGRPLADVIIPERLRAAHNRGLAHYLATGDGPVLSTRIEMPALRADGTEFPVELSINRIPGIEPPCFSGFLRDLTERKRAEAALLLLAQTKVE